MPSSSFLSLNSLNFTGKLMQKVPNCALDYLALDVFLGVSPFQSDPELQMHWNKALLIVRILTASACSPVLEVRSSGILGWASVLLAFYVKHEWTIEFDNTALISQVIVFMYFSTSIYVHFLRIGFILTALNRDFLVKLRKIHS